MRNAWRGIAWPWAYLFWQLLVLPAAETRPDQAVEIGTRRELFVDRHLVEETSGVEFRLETPRSSGIALKLDRPWEGQLCGYFTVLRDGERYRMYYRGRPLTGYGDGAKEAQEVTCVAESKDGKNWMRPAVGLFEIAGTRENNVVLADAAPVTHNFAPFVDDRAGIPGNERYKAVGGSRQSGLIAYVSEDGIRWQRLAEKPIITGGAFDSQNNAFWSHHEQRYVCYYRTFRNGVRWITRTTSPDFIHWSQATDMQFGDAPNEHLYTNQTEPYFRAPHIYIGTAARFWPDRRPLSDDQVKQINLEGPQNYERLREGCSDCILLSTRGGDRYDRMFLESFVRPGNELENWTARSNYPARGIVQTGPREMSLYVQRHYGQPTAQVERLTLRLDGFVAAHGPYSGGELRTKLIKSNGRKLVLNFATSAAGSVRVEVQKPDGTPLPGFAAPDCHDLIGDDVERTVAWKSGEAMTFAGQPVRLRFILKDADLYSYRFVE